MRENKEAYKYATFNRRMWASTIDSILAYFTLDPMVDYALAKNVAATPDISLLQLADMQSNPALLSETIGRYIMDLGVEWTAQTLALLLVVAICWKLWEASPGKMICKIRVVDAASEDPISNRQIALRCLGYIVACAPLFLGILWIGLDKRKQGWHDKIANTVVIHND